VDEQRQALCYQIVVQGRPVGQVCRGFNVSRKTAYKWLAVYRKDPGASLADRPRRPTLSPGRTDAAVEKRVLALRDAHRWGARKIHKVLLRQGVNVPSTRTVTAVLSRHGRIDRPRDTPAPREATGRFEHGRPNALWLMDHKSTLQIARLRHQPLTVIDD